MNECLFLINLILIHLYSYCYIDLGHCLKSVLLVAVLLGHAIFCNEVVLFTISNLFAV